MEVDVFQQLKAIRQGAPLFEPLSAGEGVTGWCEKELPEEVKADFLDGDQLWEPRGTVLKPGSRSTVTEIGIGKERYVLKQYKKMVLRRRLRYAVSRTRSEQSWEQGQLLARLGFSVARPLAILVERKWGIPARSKLLMEVATGDSLATLLAAEGPAARERLKAVAPRLREVFARMARLRLIHGDLTASNVIIGEDNKPTFIDLDGSFCVRSEVLYERLREKDVHGLTKNWKEDPVAAEIFDGVI
jgi:tRNA A-37 threonylcarbamoyl transferase component Bud32